MESLRVAMVPREGFGEITEAQLIERARSGDRGAFAELYRRHLRRVFHYLLTYTDTVDDAADLTQHVFLRALEALPRYRQQGMPFSAWLFRIARNAATDTYRRQRKTLPWEHLPVAWEPFTDEDPESLTLRLEVLNRLRLLVAQLSPQKQEMLYLRFAGELTAAEIGAVVGKSEAAVQRQLSRMIQRLKEQYRAEV
jgi:RNA polymerase sigma-70 factor (ECF subfamily)